MDVEERLRAIGLAETADVLSLGATIRPGVDAARTLVHAAPRERTHPARPLPRLSVDLGPDATTRRASSPSTETDLEVIGVIGEGGMGRVLIARQHSLARDVALKTAKEGAPDRVAEALLLEGEITGQLEHPSIVPVHVLGLDPENRPAIVMKRIEGVTWQALIADPGHEGWQGWDGSPDDRVPGHLQILTQVCNALHFAHSRGIVHRDVKPENVLIGRYGDVYLADWGVATRVDAPDGRLCGTPGYMAPEMVAGAPVDARTDVYLLGATLHEVLTGRLRHEAPTAMAALLAAALSEPHAYGPGVSTDLAALANRACSLEPGARPASALAFREAIADHGRHRASMALADQAVARLARAEALHAGELDEDGRRELDEAIAQARFGLEQARRQWDGNDAAREGLERLEALLEARRARAAELESLAREHDPRVAARPRAFAISVIALGGVALGGSVIFYRDAPPTPLEMVLYPSLIAPLGIATLVAFRRTVLTSAFNRKLAWMVAAMFAFMVLNRATGLFIEQEPAMIFARDAAMAGASLVIMGIAALRWAIGLGVMMLASAGLCLAWPAEALTVFGLSAAVTIVLAAALSWRG